MFSPRAKAPRLFRYFGLRRLAVYTRTFDRHFEVSRQRAGSGENRPSTEDSKIPLIAASRSLLDLRLESLSLNYLLTIILFSAYDRVNKKIGYRTFDKYSVVFYAEPA